MLGTNLTALQLPVKPRERFSFACKCQHMQKHEVFCRYIGTFTNSFMGARCRQLKTRPAAAAFCRRKTFANFHEQQLPGARSRRTAGPWLPAKARPWVSWFGALYREGDGTPRRLSSTAGKVSHRKRQRFQKSLPLGELHMHRSITLLGVNGVVWSHLILGLQCPRTWGQLCTQQAPQNKLHKISSTVT